MKNSPITADRDVDALYAGLRGAHGAANPRANGYVNEHYFRREQHLLFALLDPHAEVLCDVACGSGLMMLPLVRERACVFGIDFNAAACAAARDNGLPVVRGDAFRLPLHDASVDQVVNCQFFNQQTPAAVRAFVGEVARVLVAGGRAVFVWRNGTAWVHRIALAVFGTLDRLRGRASFPHVDHALADLRALAREAGLTVVHESVSFPPLAWHSTSVSSPLARLIGASNICILEKPADDAT